MDDQLVVVGLVHSKTLTVLMLKNCLKFENNRKAKIPIDFSFKYANFRLSQVEMEQSNFQVCFALYKLGEA